MRRYFMAAEAAALRPVAALLMAAPLCLAAVPAGAQTSASPAITLRGSCSVTLPPDRGRLVLAAVQGNADPGRAAAAAAAQISRLKAGVSGLNLGQGQIVALGVTLDRDTDEDAANKRRGGYIARAALMIETAEITRLGEAMQLAGNAGLAEIGSVETFLSPAARDKIVTDCLPRAAADARARADQLLAGIGARSGAVQRVDGYDVDGDGGGPPRPRPMLRMVAAAPMPAPEVSAGTLTVTVSTTVSFAVIEGK